MKRPKFVKVVTNPRPRASTDIAGIRRMDDQLNIGDVVPVQWFQIVPDAIFAQLINPSSEGGWGVLVEHTPDTREMAYLREMYPVVFGETDTPLTDTPLHVPTAAENTDYPAFAPAKRKPKLATEEGE